MNRRELRDNYLDWMHRLVYDGRYSKKLSYKKLLNHLTSREFIYILDMDGNRAEDGMDLRYRFGYEYGYDNATISLYLDEGPCTVMEMMVALSKRCEDDIMDNPASGNRTGQWFWSMIVSLGLGNMSDINYEEHVVDRVLDNFMKRTYSPDGRGGLFTIDGINDDLRQVEIWTQMHWYLANIVGV